MDDGSQPVNVRGLKCVCSRVSVLVTFHMHISLFAYLFVCTCVRLACVTSIVPPAKMPEYSSFRLSDFTSVIRPAAFSCGYVFF